MSDVYGYSFCQETFHGRHETREAAVAEAMAHAPDAGQCWTCRGVDVRPSDYLPDAWRLLEQIEDGIADNHANEDPIFNPTKEQRTDLEKRMTQAFEAWMEAYPTAWRRYYEADDIEKHEWAVDVGATDPALFTPVDDGKAYRLRNKGIFREP